MLNQFKRNSILCGKGKTTTTGWDMIRHANREPLRRDRRGRVRRQPNNSRSSDFWFAPMAHSKKNRISMPMCMCIENTRKKKMMGEKRYWAYSINLMSRWCSSCIYHGARVQQVGKSRKRRGERFLFSIKTMKSSVWNESGEKKEKRRWINEIRKRKKEEIKRVKVAVALLLPSTEKKTKHTQRRYRGGREIFILVLGSST